MLYAFTTASLPGGDRGPRYVAADIHVKSKEGKTIIHEVFKLHSAEKTLAIDWVVPRGERWLVVDGDGGRGDGYGVHTVPSQFPSRTFQGEDSEGSSSS